MHDSDKITSIRFSDCGIPVLCDAGSLRKLGGGQLDYSFILNGELVLVEAKTKPIISKKQIWRLRNTAKILSRLINPNSLTIYMYIHSTNQLIRI